jgi:RNA polymerase sigma-70 factor (ECF subfamily)
MRAEPAEAVVDPVPAAAEIAAWVQHARAGDHAAYERLYRAHVGRVFALCLRLSGDRGRAGELAQDAFVLAWRKLSLLDADEAFASWMYRLTTNVVLMSMRRDKRWNAREVGADSLDGAEPVRAGRDENVAAGIDLERAIAGLPSQARVVFVLHDVEGYRHEDIAAQMSIAIGTSKAQLHRARRLLREALER